MKQINSRESLGAELIRLKALNKVQDEALTARFHEIEKSLRPENLLREGITRLVKGDEEHESFIPALVGAGVEAGLKRLLRKGEDENSPVASWLKNLLGNLLKDTPGKKEEQD